MPRARSPSIAAIMSRAGSPRCRRTCSTPAATGARCASSRAAKAGSSISSTRQRCGGASAGAFLAVSRANRASRRRHRASALPGAAATQASRRLALVGKGICFDTGGINLKTHKSMYHMHEDMQGSAVAVGTLLALSALRSAVRHRLLARDHREPNRCARVSSAGSGARRERRDDPGRAQRCRRPHGAGRHAGARRARDARS